MRPCVALLHGYDPRSGLSADPEVSLIPILDAREVEAVFTAPLEGFLKSDLNGFDGYEDGHEWYRGTWGVWHDSNWRSKSDSFPFDCFSGFFSPSRRCTQYSVPYTWGCRTNHAEDGL